MRTKTRKKIKRIRLLHFEGVEQCVFCKNEIDKSNLWNPHDCNCLVKFSGHLGRNNWMLSDKIPVGTIIIVGELDE
jgi:hypothetical protein